MALSSANYTINEWLDAPFDAMHPTKRARPAVQTAMSPTIVFAQYILLTTVGMLAANTLGDSFSLVAAVFAVFGVIYNVRPIRAKDRAFLDVIVESAQQPAALPVRLVRGHARLSRRPYRSCSPIGSAAPS